MLLFLTLAPLLGVRDEAPVDGTHIVWRWHQDMAVAIMYCGLIVTFLSDASTAPAGVDFYLDDNPNAAEKATCSNCKAGLARAVR